MSNKAVFGIIMSPACGKKNENGISDYIINGQDAGPNEWPWMAAIVSVRSIPYGDMMSLTSKE